MRKRNRIVVDEHEHERYLVLHGMMKCGIVYYVLRGIPRDRGAQYCTAEFGNGVIRIVISLM